MFILYELCSLCNLEKMMNDMIEKMIETMKENMLQCFNQLREDDNVHTPNFSLRSPTTEVNSS